jgi:hypothetical protein
MPNKLWGVYWTPANWVCCFFPRPTNDASSAQTTWIIEQLEYMVSLATDADYTPMQRAPAVLNLLTGEPVTSERTREPARLFRKLNARLASSEFAVAIAHAEALQ